MPELPEVETIRRGLKEVIVGKKIIGFEKRDPKIIQFEPENIEGYSISDIERRAKILIFRLSHGRKDLSHVAPSELRGTQLPLTPTAKGGFEMGQDDKIMLVHLKMTGQLIWEENPGVKDFQLRKGPSTPLRAEIRRISGGHPSPDWVAKLPNAYTRAIVRFEDGSVLFFNDLRRFGYMKLYSIQDSEFRIQNQSKYTMTGFSDIPELSKLGPEPFSAEFTVEYLMRKAAKIPNRKTKQFITDQEIISGVGNIYVDEALFYAKISPLRLVKDIKLNEWQKIRDSIIKALELGLEYGGSSEDTYVDAFGNQGTMNDHTKVYRHTGADCPASCGGTIKRIVIGGRGTHFCPKCQS
ncbi:MAG: bifunctional DNA-formamidopyrimidine glycosylase/DNA-(apurinic or apyrimidinic site) lyase [Candidatus Berkelbacteria bacterium]|nr:bifunctional DNA-formamidopyrimidine glycosylase/DNA-(apurinic or apyrimidinic site) lyase [Candidatus Berkelbacteria bacterium]